jgi:lipoprotein-releasing system ATP-binding protein
MEIFKANNISKYFYQPEKFKVLNNISISLNQSEMLAMVGKSGCGKSTLLYILSTMDTDYDGTIYLKGQKITGQTQTQLAHIRNENIGFVFQFHYLLPDFTCLKNVMIPGLRLGKYKPNEVEQIAYEKLKQLGVHEQALKPASKLSGGQQQRVAIARALINNPAIIMCDEPTGNLDSKNTGIVYDIFRELITVNKTSIICVTHDNDFASKADRIIEMKDGEMIG